MYDQEEDHAASGELLVVEGFVYKTSRVGGTTLPSSRRSVQQTYNISLSRRKRRNDSTCPKRFDRRVYEACSCHSWGISAV